MKTVRGATIDLICWCDKLYTARVADVKRGWAFSCCKSHAAIKRDYGRSNPRDAATGKHLDSVSKKKKPKRKTPDTRVYTNNREHGIGYGHILVSGDEGHGQE